MWISPFTWRELLTEKRPDEAAAFLQVVPCWVLCRRCVHFFSSHVLKKEHFASGASKADSTTAIHIEISSWGVMGWVNSMCMVADGAKGTQEACCRHWPLVLSSRWMGTLVAPLIQPTTIAIKGSKQCNAQAVQGSEQRV
jgi:hypothetical protein